MPTPKIMELYEDFANDARARSDPDYAIAKIFDSGILSDVQKELIVALLSESPGAVPSEAPLTEGEAPAEPAIAAAAQVGPPATAPTAAPSATPTAAPQGGAPIPTR